MTRRTTRIVTLAASLALGCGISFGQQTTPRPGQPETSDPSGRMSDMNSRSGQDMQQQFRQIAQDPKTAADKLFVLNVAMCNQEEIDLARQAEQKAQSPQVKQIAQKVQRDHEQANQQLRPLAQQLGVQLPQSVSPDMQQMNQILASLPTDQFEKHFIAILQAQHAANLIMFRTCAQISQNDQIRQYAQQQLPILAQHYEQAQQVGVALGLPSGGPEAIPASGRIEGTSGSSRTGNNAGNNADTSDPNTRGFGNTNSSDANGTGNPVRSGNTGGTGNSGSSR